MLEIEAGKIPCEMKFPQLPWCDHHESRAIVDGPNPPPSVMFKNTHTNI